MLAPFSEEGLVLGTLPGLPLATKDQQPEGVHAGLRLDQGPKGQGATARTFLPQYITPPHLGVTLKRRLAVWQTIRSSVQQLPLCCPYCVPGPVLSTC